MARSEQPVDRRVFWGSVALVAPFLAMGAVAPEATGRLAAQAFQWITGAFGGLYLILVSLFVLVGIGIAASPLGRIRLGPDDEAPEFGRISWFAMLFSAGMGIGLMFWSVAEPMIHLGAPPIGEARSAGAASLAFEIFFFHWGVHAWATYVVVGLALAYSHFRKGEPMLVSRCLVSLGGRKWIEGGLGAVVDVLAVWATVMGVVTSLGLGALQITSGLHLSFGIPDGKGTDTVVIGVITLLFVMSAVSGVNRGIKLLSNVNVGLMLVLLGFFLLYGPSGFIVSTFARTLLTYMRDMIPWSTQTVLFENPGWTRSWTVFYWAWWIAWAPFVGAFIARISKGRTVREFTIGVMLLPPLFSFLFSAALGGTAVQIDRARGGPIAAMVQSSVESALFGILRYLPHSEWMSVLANVLIATFFITSADSATYVVNGFTTGGGDSGNRRLVVFWGMALGAIAAVMLYAGGLKGLQTASIVGSLPFLLVMVLLMISTIREIWRDSRSPDFSINLERR
jgi:glycine betaine transporter